MSADDTGKRNSRPPRQAYSDWLRDAMAGVRPTRSDREFGFLDNVWARWAALAAGSAAAELPTIPRIQPSIARYDSAQGGATLYRLPGHRAVLSGGASHGPRDDNPNLFVAAPEWVTDEVLDPRVFTGGVAFCYWWDSQETWHRGESPDSATLAELLPPIRTREATVDALARMRQGQPDPAQRSQAERLVSAATAGTVTREAVAELFDEQGYDVDAAMQQCAMAGVARITFPPISQLEAIALVGEYAVSNRLDTTNYPLEELVAKRLSVGWLVFVPPPPGEITFGRALFFVADDGVVERSNSAQSVQRWLPGFEQRFQQRRRA